MEKSAHKLELIKKIAELEKQELWHLDVEDDPETYPLMPDKIDYLNEKFSNKIKNKIANIFGARFFDKMIANRQLIIKEVRGIENFTAVKGGKIVTCNHFSVGDNYAVWVALRDYMDGRMHIRCPYQMYNFQILPLRVHLRSLSNRSTQSLKYKHHSSCFQRLS